MGFSASIEISHDNSAIEVTPDDACDCDLRIATHGRNEFGLAMSTIGLANRRASLRLRM